MNDCGVASASPTAPLVATAITPSHSQRRSPREWLLFLSNLGGVSLIVFAVTDTCPAIQQLPAYCISFATISLLHGTLNFLFRLDVHRQSSRNTLHHLHDTFGVSLIAVGCWGASMTWPHLLDQIGGRARCSTSLFASGFISSTLALGVVGLLVARMIVNATCRHRRKPGAAAPVVALAAGDHLLWAPRAAEAMRGQVLGFLSGADGAADTDPGTRSAAGLRAAYRAWLACEYPATASPPLHSKCIGFALPGGREGYQPAEYFAVYLMDRAALSAGQYAYGRDVLLGWPGSAIAADGEGGITDSCGLSRSFRAYEPSKVLLESAAGDEGGSGGDVLAGALRHVYEWTGEYDVTRRPWFACGRAIESETGAWTAPYSDPVTAEQIVSYVAPVRTASGALQAVIIAGAFRCEDEST